MNLVFYVAEDGAGQVVNVATTNYLEKEGLTEAEVLEIEGVRKHSIVVRPFTGLLDRNCNNRAAGNDNRWADVVVEEAVVSWTVDKPILDESGKEIGRELYPHTEQGLLSMPIILANVIRLVVQEAVYLPVRNPFKKPR